MVAHTTLLEISCRGSYSHCIIFNISNKYNDFGFRCFQKTYFKNFPNLNALGSKLTLTLSRSRLTLDHHLNKIGKPHIPNATNQVQR